MTRLRVIVSGLIAQYPLGGVTWDYFQYVLGLARLGHDVFYIEDTGQWPYHPLEGGLAKDCGFSLEYLARVMARFGLADRWAYRFPWQAQWFGLPDCVRRQVISSADLVINVSGTLERPEDYRQSARLVYIDSDPMFTQIKLAQNQTYFRKQIDAHDVHFSFGETLSVAAPATGHRWRPTRQPVVLSEWRKAPPRRNAFTTVMNWTSYKDVVFEGETYGQKDVEFLRFLDLPRQVAPAVLEVGINVGKTRHTPYKLLGDNGWRLADAGAISNGLDSYRDYIESSKGEWSVAKNAYVKGRTGWFSCRSACYLAAGKPVVVQDTGFSSVFPVGDGILPFNTPEQAAHAIREVEGDYPRHAEAARSIAEEWFRSDKVLTRLLDEATSDGG